MLKTKSIEEITIREIVETCGISRASFYRYFRDKFDLLNWIFSQYMDELTGYYNHTSLCYRQVTFDITSFMANSRTLFQKCFSYMGQNSFQEYFLSCLTNYVGNHLKELMYVDELTPEYQMMVSFNSMGVLYTINNWLQNGCRESPEEITKIIIDSMPEKVKKYFVAPGYDKWDLVHSSNSFEYI